MTKRLFRIRPSELSQTIPVSGMEPLNFVLKNGSVILASIHEYKDDHLIVVNTRNSKLRLNLSEIDEIWRTVKEPVA